jgi:hypothetical protein
VRAAGREGGRKEEEVGGERGQDEGGEREEGDVKYPNINRL